MDDNAQQGGQQQEDSAQQMGAQNDGASAVQSDLERANEQIRQLTETAKYALADLQNYRKRMEQERMEFVQFSTIKIITELLPILDNFTRAFAHVPEDVAGSDWFKGTLAIEQQLVGIMRKQGVSEVPSAVGQPLDPKFHEAITTGPGEEGVVIEEYEKGYLLGERVIRPAKVKVGIGN